MTIFASVTSLHRRLLWATACLMLISAVSPAPTFAATADGATTHIAAAADLQFALPEIAAEFTRRHGHKLSLSFGSSGNFARQISQGAPFQLFLAADEETAQRVVSVTHAGSAPRPYAIGRLALFIPTGSSIAADNKLADFSAAVRDGRLQRLAIANPEHAPYGRAAREVLLRLEVWEALQGRLALGDNAAQAAQFAASGAAQAGLVPLSLARSVELSKRGSFVTIPEKWHGPLRQMLVPIRGAGPAALAFADFMQTDEARAILSRHGFGLPPR